MLRPLAGSGFTCHGLLSQKKRVFLRGMRVCNEVVDLYSAVNSLGMRYTVVICFKMLQNREKLRK